MSLPRLRFTIGQLVRMVVFCAIAFAFLRTPIAPLVVFAIALMIICASLPVVIVSITLLVVIKIARIVSPEPLGEGLCGPIVWRGFDDDRGPKPKPG